MRTHHSGRTIDVASQQTHINVHKMGRQGQEDFDLWFTVLPQQAYRLSRFIYENQPIDLVRQIEPTDPRYSEINSAIRQPLDMLIALIQSI